MSKKIDIVEKIAAEKCRKFEVNSTVNLFDLIDGNTINEYNLFIAQFNRLPNCMRKVDIDCRQANEWFAKTYETEIKDCYYSQRFLKIRKQLEYDDIYYLLHEDLLVYFNTDRSIVTLLFKKTDVEVVRRIMDEIRKFGKKTSRHRLLAYWSMGVTD
ncbi:hypothetical protein EZS27_011235 [termite gut metagenome]|uniref:Uncharacterized protein n=1 Tax=termite gut metagenome TaxID=433724 RepID=A0A5J4S6E1_9ZZZZ